KVVLLIPPNAEFEIGFPHWARKVNRLVKQAGARLVVYSTDKSFSALQDIFIEIKGVTDLQHKKLDEPEDFLVVARDVTDDDMIVAVNARKGSLTYAAYMDNLANRITKH